MIPLRQFAAAFFCGPSIDSRLDAVHMHAASISPAVWFQPLPLPLPLRQPLPLPALPRCKLTKCAAKGLACAGVVLLPALLVVIIVICLCVADGCKCKDEHETIFILPCRNFLCAVACHR